MTQFKTRTLLLWLLIHLLGLQIREANAQTNHYEKHFSAKAYWTLKTDPVLRTTRVEFYDEQHQLRYQETLADRYINLTPRNIRRFDAILYQVIHNQLVLSQLKTDPLPLAEQYREIPVVDTLPEPMIEADVHVTTGGKLRVAYVNIAQQRVQIELLDEQKHVLYQCNTMQPRFAQYLDLSQLAFGQYTLSLQSRWQHLIYPVNIRSRTHYETQPKGPNVVFR